MKKAKKWHVTGPVGRSGGAPATLWVFDNRSVRLDYNNGTFVRFVCWSCAMQKARLSIVDGPWAVDVADNY
jgi:hypothetical protein